VAVQRQERLAGGLDLLSFFARGDVHLGDDGRALAGGVEAVLLHGQVGGLELDLDALDELLGHGVEEDQLALFGDRDDEELVVGGHDGVADALLEEGDVGKSGTDQAEQHQDSESAGLDGTHDGSS
jgi:hypothetical protein